jgi:hypothetical protein
MAGWTTNDWTAGAIQKHTDEIWKAFNERKQAWGSAAVPVPQAGANIQKGFYYNYYSGGPIPPADPTGTFSWFYLQRWIEWRCHFFVRSHNDDGTIRASDYYDGESAIETWTFADLMKVVRGDGTAQASWRRATTFPADWTNWNDPAYSAGEITNGVPRDILGPWIPTDIQKALNMLVWTPVPSMPADPSITWTNNGGQIVGNTAYERDSDRAAAIAACENAWIEDTSTQVMSPSASSAIYQDTDWQASMDRRHPWGQITGLPIVGGINRDIDWYFYPIASYYTWSDQGDGVQQDKWNLWLTDPAVAGSSTVTSSQRYKSGRFATAPNLWIPTGEGTRGYTSNWESIKAIIRWNIPDGFGYQ